ARAQSSRPALPAIRLTGQSMESQADPVTDDAFPVEPISDEVVTAGSGWRWCVLCGGAILSGLPPVEGRSLRPARGGFLGQSAARGCYCDTPRARPMVWNRSVWSVTPRTLAACGPLAAIRTWVPVCCWDSLSGAVA